MIPLSREHRIRRSIRQELRLPPPAIRLQRLLLHFGMDLPPHLGVVLQWNAKRVLHTQLPQLTQPTLLPLLKLVILNIIWNNSGLLCFLKLTL